ncbi:hypothetical protein Bbelb_182120 [Branchiostoma belcheri]|nr:hypothetical protein Bbelb_182120 [Branchiostoma belcheri]
MAYNGKYMHGMGWTLVVMGTLNIILGIAADAAFGNRCYSASIALHVVNAVLAFTEVVMAFVAAIMPCCGLACCRLRNNPNDAPVVVYNQQGPNMTPGQAAYVIMQTGVPGTEGAPYTTVSAAGGMPQQLAAGVHRPTSVPCRCSHARVLCCTNSAPLHATVHHWDSSCSWSATCRATCRDQNPATCLEAGVSHTS